MATARTMTTTDAVRWIESSPRPIEKATDLGNVQVLKHSNLYLLTDQFGDIHPDGRGLGLYDGDTRRLSCAILRRRAVSGRCCSRRPPARTTAARSSSPTRGWSGTSATRSTPRSRWPARSWASLGDGRWPRQASRSALRLVNYSEVPETVDLELEFSNDAADIFEVRGWTREERGTYPPIAVRDDRITFRYDGLDGVRRYTYIAFSRPPSSSAGTTTRRAIPARWSGHGAGPWSPAGLRTCAGCCGPRRVRSATTGGACSRIRPMSRVTRRAPRITRGTGASRDPHGQRAVQHRAPAQRRRPAPAVNDGPGDSERYIAAGVPWFSTLFGRDSLIASFQALAFRPQLAVETLEVLASLQATRTTRSGRGAGQDPPRAPDGRDGPGARDPAHAVLRLGRLDAAVLIVLGATSTGPATWRWPTGSGPTCSPRSSGSTAGATATATGSSSTSGAPARAW